MGPGGSSKASGQRQKRSLSPETQFDENGIGTKSWSDSEIFGTHPSLERAWLRSDLVNLKIHTSQMPLQPQASPQLRARVLHAEDRHRGTLVLYKSQVIVQDSPLKRAELCLVDFPDFITPERQWRSIAGIGTSEREKLQSVASELGGDATVKIRPSPHRIVLDSGDGWNIALTKDKQQTRGLICHTGLVTRSDDGEYPTDALDDVLDGLNWNCPRARVGCAWPPPIPRYSRLSTTATSMTTTTSAACGTQADWPLLY